MTNTFQTMQNRIADEVGMRTDLLPQIANAINTAIAHQANEKFYFNEYTDTFSTVTQQMLYTADSVLTYDPAAIQSIKITMPGGYTYPLSWWSWDRLNQTNVNPNYYGQPYAFSWYNGQIALFPAPYQALVCTVYYTPNFPVLVNNTDTNVWMNQGEEMIRAFAKADLYSNVLMAEANAPQLADRNVAIGKSAKKSLRYETVNKNSAGRVTPTRF